jgi:FkbM family methyltransferase
VRDPAPLRFASVTAVARARSGVRGSLLNSVDRTRLLKAVRHFNRIPEILRCRDHTKDWSALTSAYVGFKSALPFEVELASGPFQFREPSDVATFWQIFYRRIYPVRTSDRLIVDAGANIGAFTLFALLNAPEADVVAVEPAPDSCARIRSLLIHHKVASRCTLHEAALASANGETTIQLDVGSQFRRSGGAGKPVSAVTLDSLIPTDATIDFLKMDVEGAEYDVLPSVGSATIRRIRRIALEYHPQVPPERVLNHLAEHGFSLVAQQDDGGGYGIVWLQRRDALN